MAGKFLSDNGLTYFWGKLKSWVSSHFLALTGGTVTGALTVEGQAEFDNPINIADQTSLPVYTFATVPSDQANIPTGPAIVIAEDTNAVYYYDGVDDDVVVGGLSGTVPVSIANGGTGATTVSGALANLGLSVTSQTTGFSQNTTNVNTMSNQEWYSAGNAVCFRIVFTTKISYSANTTYEIGTAPAGFRPPMYQYLATSNANATAYIDSGGAVTFRPTATVASGTSIGISGSYIIP